MLVSLLSTLSCALALIPGTSAYYTWKDTKYFFAFGASYTDIGWDITSGISSAPTWKTYVNGPNWVMSLAQRYNVSSMALYDTGSYGAVIDNSIIPTGTSTSKDLVTQVSSWNSVFSSHPSAAPWTSDNSVFMFWIGLNDVSNSVSDGYTATTRPAVYTKVINQFTAQLQILYNAGARNFLINNILPIQRTPRWLNSGSATVSDVNNATMQFNSQLATSLASFISTHNTSAMIAANGALGQVKIHDTYTLFNTLLDNAAILGYADTTGYCSTYTGGTSTPNTQVEPCLPTSAYFWLNDFHPLWTIHDVVGKAIQTMLSG